MAHPMAQAVAAASGPTPEIDPSKSDIQLKPAFGEKMSLLGWVAKELHEAQKRARPFQAKGLRNELYYMGEHFKDIDGATMEQEDLAWNPDVPQVHRNYTRSLINTYASRIQRDRPWVAPFQNDMGGTDQAAVPVARAILYHLYSENELDNLFFEATPFAECHGSVGFKVTWDTERGPPSAGIEAIDDDGSPVIIGQDDPTGDVSVEEVTIFDFFLDGSKDESTSNWVIFREMISADDAEAQLKEAKIDDEPDLAEYSDVRGDKREGVEELEVWHRPNRYSQFPFGWYARIVSGHVVEFFDYYPYPHGELPVAVWRVGKRRGSSYGTTHVDDAIPIQRQINELVSVIQKLTRDCGSMRFVGHPALIDSFTAGNGTVAIASAEQRRDNGWIEPPRPPPLLFAQLDELIKALFDLFGLNEILTGQENVRAGTSARQIAYLAELDSQKLAGSARSLAKCVKRIARQALKLYQHFVQEERLVSLGGEENALGAAAFIGADLAGMDVRLESASAFDALRGAEAGRAEEDMMNGAITPQEGMERRRTGMPTTSDEAWAVRLVQEQILGVMRGAQAAPSPMVDPAVAVREIREAIGVARGRAPDMVLQALDQLLMAYMEGAQAAAMQQGQQGAQPEPMQAQAQGQGGTPEEDYFTGAQP